MREAVLHYIWQKQLFNHSNLQTTAGQSLQIYKPGAYNPYSGPDFQHAQVSIGNLQWFGHIEIHTKSSEWYHHKHQHDNAYQNTILHVVLNEDKPIFLADGSLLPTLVLADRLPPQPPIKAYFGMQALVCRHQFSQEKAKALLPSLAEERLINKSGLLLLRLQELSYDWGKLAYETLLIALFTPHNREAAQLLTDAIPAKTLYQLPATAWEALLLFGAGLLTAPTEIEGEEEAFDAYQSNLWEQVQYYQGRVGYPLPASVWKTGKIRPTQNPALKLAIFASILEAEGPVYEWVFNLNKASGSQQLQHKAHSYWSDHYALGKESAKAHPNYLSKDTINLLFINGILPLQVAWLRFQGKEAEAIALALEELASLPAEKNAITRFMQTEGHEAPKTALESQALIQLYKVHCVPVRCSSCSLYPIQRG